VAVGVDVAAPVIVAALVNRNDTVAVADTVIDPDRIVGCVSSTLTSAQSSSFTSTMLSNREHG
jgi:hypothetical protein